MLEGSRVVVFCAHPDDETIGLGGCLANLRDVRVVHATDGAPRDLRDATAHGFATREDYARARRQELLEALEIAGIGERQTSSLGIVDQEASYKLAGLARRTTEVIREYRPTAVFSPAYEGGHPDHDAVAFAVHAASRLAGVPFEIREYALYHCRSGRIATLEFLPGSGGSGVETISLDEKQRERKRRMMECFRTQRETLRPFAIGRECLRSAPAYDFTRPPQAECIYYDQFPWGIGSRAWVANAQAALKSLGVHGAI